MSVYLFKSFASKPEICDSLPEASIIRKLLPALFIVNFLALKIWIVTEDQ